MTSPTPESRSRRALRVAVLVVAAFLLQTVVFPGPWIERLVPDFILAAVFGLAVRRGAGPGIGFGLGAGLLQDSFSGGFLGIHGSSKPLTAAVVAGVAARRGLSHAAVLVLAILASVVDAAVLGFLAWVTGADVTGRLRAIAFGIPLTVVAGWLAARWLAPPTVSEI